MRSKNTSQPFRHQPRKRFGQNFLHDENVIRRIVDCIAPSADDHIVEIGPGQGALTRHLLHECGTLDAIEIDRDLAAYLSRTLQQEKPFQIHQCDILKFDLATLTDQPSSLRIIGNLPYNISTPVIFHLLEKHHLIKDMTFMLQLEVVNRLAAKAGNKNYGRLGLMAQYYCEVEHLFNVPSAAFTPQPKVSSAIVRLTPHRVKPVEAIDVECLKNVIRTAFNQRRKTLRNSLKTLMSEQQLEQLQLDLSLRPERLTLSDYVSISNALSS
ncbi:MAG: 16S rRNA (adenine(1518)-N(6)/adenine(1519)-N(6))-dimethyltransferase RsmA [Gammaproteobacteria bacterium]|nr:16S rRNA (adenine(1518)-N(6)/adenine(1519)-N(6))-dimethyltransferase RsmA [Gammaproteobacteria bacterium]